MTSYDELLALLPDNTTGQIDASDIREVVRYLTPTHLVHLLRSPKVVPLIDNDWAVVLLSPADLFASRDDWDMERYISPLLRYATIMLAVEAQTGFRVRLVRVRGTETIALIDKVLDSNGWGEGWATTDLMLNDLIQVQCRAVPGPQPQTTFSHLQLGITATLQKPMEVPS